MSELLSVVGQVALAVGVWVFIAALAVSAVWAVNQINGPGDCGE